MAKPLPLPVWDRQAGKLIEEFMDDHPSTYERQAAPFAKPVARIRAALRLAACSLPEYAAQRAADRALHREFRPGARTFVAAPDEMAAFAEARYFGWERLEADKQFPIKGHSLSAEKILGIEERAAPFIGGPVLLARLSPMDYHHVHYPDDGKTRDNARLGCSLWTVNWHALQNQPDIQLRNERQIDILETETFGQLAFVEVGAMSVGRIVQVHPREAAFHRGEEKSVFKFGGSAIVLFGEPGKWRPADDILQHTTQGIETLIRLGDTIAVRGVQP